MGGGLDPLCEHRGLEIMTKGDDCWVLLALLKFVDVLLVGPVGIEPTTQGL
jgi:hypothetical protein